MTYEEIKKAVFYAHEKPDLLAKIISDIISNGSKDNTEDNSEQNDGE